MSSLPLSSRSTHRYLIVFSSWYPQSNCKVAHLAPLFNPSNLLIAKTPHSISCLSLYQVVMSTNRMPQAELLWLLSCNIPADWVRETTQSTFIDVIWKVITTQTRYYQPTADNTDIHYLVILSIYAHYLYSIVKYRPEVCVLELSRVTDAGDTCIECSVIDQRRVIKSCLISSIDMAQNDKDEESANTNEAWYIINSSIAQIIR